MSGYATIVADPPWRTRAGPGTFSDGGHSRALPYSTMSVRDIAALPVGDLAATNAHLYLWTINGFLEAAFEVVRAWGFTYSTTHVWAKEPMGCGLGDSFGITTEFLLFARRGRAPMRNRSTGTWHAWKRPYVDGAPCHSKKPPESYALVEHASHGPFVELFSRATQPRLGWSYWGNESLGTASLQASPQHPETP